MDLPPGSDAHLESNAPPLADFAALAVRAAQLLRTPQALVNLSPAESTCVVEHMRLVHFAKGVTLLREGDRTRVDFMLLLLDGDVSVETSAGGASDAVSIAVVGPGSVIGEMALLDGAPRSTSCIALSPGRAAGLSRKELERLIESHPQVAAKLLVGLASRIADRLRGLGEQLQMYAKLSLDLQAEVARLRASARR